MVAQRIIFYYTDRLGSTVENSINIVCIIHIFIQCSRNNKFLFFW